MNGNITREGITADLEAMRRMGICGALCFNNATGIPRGPVDYASEDWISATVHAASEAQRLGLTLMLHNSPGYSGTGGPWVTPEMSMQQLVWSETTLMGGRAVEAELSQPRAKLGWYRDAMVIAYPALAVEGKSMRERVVHVTCDGRTVPYDLLLQGTAEKKLRLDRPGAAVVFEFDNAFEARAISILRQPEEPENLFDGPRDMPPLFLLEASHDGLNYVPVVKISMPALREMDTPGTQSFEAVEARFFRLVTQSPTWLSSVELHAGPRLEGWPGKTGFDSLKPESTAVIEQALAIDPATVVDITRYMDEHGRLHWAAPEGRWTVLRLGHTTTGEICFAAPDAAEGLQTDKYRRAAMDLHFSALLTPLCERLKPYFAQGDGGGFRGVSTDSWEAGKQNWTPDFPQEFRRLRGYDLLGWMPAMTGRIVGSVQETERFLWDVRRSFADLLAVNYYGYLAERMHALGLEFHAEPYGDGNFDSLQAAQYLDVPMSEFWTRYIYGSEMTSKQAASAAHIYGKSIAAAEAFTGMPLTSKWSEYPYSLKAEADWFLTLGINRLVFHVFVHQPYMTGLPGMTMGPFGTHFDRNNTWTEQAHGWLSCLRRCQHVLQQGKAAVDVCYFKGDDPAIGVPDLYRLLPRGIVGDVLGPDLLRHRLSVDATGIVLPDGMRYRALVLAPVTRLTVLTLKRLSELVTAGLQLIVTSKPAQALGHSGDETEFVRLVSEIWGDLDGAKRLRRRIGKGEVLWPQTLADGLRLVGIEPDFDFTAEQPDAMLHFIHRRIDDAEVYFVSNHRRRDESVVCNFRALGQPEIWNPETGESWEQPLYEQREGATYLPLQLAPAGAVFVVFRKSLGRGKTEAIASVLKDGIELLSTRGYRSPEAAPHTARVNDFSIAVWLKPDTYAHPNKSFVFHAPDGASAYGKNHVAMALAAGQNAVRVYERGNGVLRQVLISERPLEGWTHVAVVYAKGAPSLYINGALAASADASGAMVHPGLGTPAADEQFSNTFEGHHTAPQLFEEAVPLARVHEWFNAGLPPPPVPTVPELRREANESWRARFWQNGEYLLRRVQHDPKVIRVDGCQMHTLSGAWKVKFPSDSGAPAEIVLSTLISFREHSDFGVRHFSGTALYSREMNVPSGMLRRGRSVFLHLGRVEVIARVRVNGQDMGLLWKEPYMVDITSALHPGKNSVEVDVTTLWPNRLIGDEALPVENKYDPNGFIERLPDWYRNNEKKPGKRVGFSTWHHFDSASPMLDSGLLGPVKLLTAQEIIQI